MESFSIKLPKGKFLSEIEPFFSKGLYTNSIYHKGIPGCGITRYAIEWFKHNLILALPNKPVVEEKTRKHNELNPKEKVLGVYKGVTVKDIKLYLLSDVKYKKILTTPEGFVDKVLKAFDDLELMRNNYFMLFDECERIITDVNYRGKIAAPLKEFFKFKNKALVSATTLPFSDERFKDFKHYTIEPTYDYSKTLTVIESNSVVQSFHKIIKSLNTDYVFVFFNSTNGIYAFTKSLGLTATSKAYCAQTSVIKLRARGFVNAFSYFDDKSLSKYSFMTSRYFSAYDIELDFKPDVIMITDVVFADHSVLDPHTEVIQIAGRFRNGVESLTHITNIDPTLNVKSKEELLYYLQGCFDTYDGFVKDYNEATHPGRKDSFLTAIQASPAFPYYDEDEINSFMLDNAIHTEKVKGYYQDLNQLKGAYLLADKHFNVTFEHDLFPISDQDKLSVHLKQTKPEKYKIIAEMIDKVSSRNGRIVLFGEEERDSLIKAYPEIYKAYWLIGLEGLENTGYEMENVRKAIAYAENIKELRRLSVLVQGEFKEFQTYDQLKVAEVIQRIYTTYNSKRKVSAEDIKRFFNGRRTTQSKRNVYVLKDKIDYSLIQNFK